jgi:hypothetical protein
MSGKRAQTTQDFAIGISVFLLTITFAFAYLPSTLASGDAEIEQQAYAADKLTASIFANVTATDGANRLDGVRAQQFFAWHPDDESLRANYSLQGTASANVTLETLGGTTVDIVAGGTTVSATAGDAYDGQVAATTTRIVWLDGTRHRLVVRVW